MAETKYINTMKKLIVLLILMFSATASLFAVDFTYEGVNYTVLNEAKKPARLKQES